VNDISEEDIFAPGFDNEGATEQGQLVATSLASRVSMCNGWPANYYISIHHNAVGSPDPNFTVVYYGERAAGPRGSRTRWTGQP